MSLAVKQAELIYDSHDSGLLNEHVRWLVGEPFLFEVLTYGDESIFHFGPHCQRRSKSRTIACGTYELWCRGSLVQSTLTKRSANMLVTEASVTVMDDSYQLTLTLSDGATLAIIPIIDDVKDVAVWELFLSGNRCLHVGSGLVWSCLPCDVPIVELELLAPQTFGMSLAGV